MHRPVENLTIFAEYLPVNPVPYPSFWSQAWRDLSNKFRRKVLGQNRVPWMKTRELDVIMEVLANVKPEFCLEWGSGFSTLYFPEHIPSLKHWYALEHHKGWFDTIKTGIRNPKAEVMLVEPDDPDYFNRKERYNPKMEGLYEDFHTYIEQPRNFNLKFDFIFIDGRARKECLKVAYELVSDHGAVIVHDANRSAYFEDLPPFESSFRLTDYRAHRKEGGIWIGRKKGQVSQILSTDRHARTWKIHNAVAKGFFLR